ncbi:serine incorporator 1-like isoform X1 [Biomphalaria pfeifferi]|uniref:Serine incorporator 1-like isoform X1 n=1 Tax=Biomphalaria pfeifferi TaxID=112525 RepID=A0AAD8B945_BIOPF|nr:serine incorporator 1-like isoform X1 [Biomphalaria pfeifferi]
MNSWLCRGFFGSEVFTDSECNLIIGFLAAYRVCFAMTMFFVLLFLITINVPSSNGYQARIHNGVWPIKISFLIIICVVAFYIPEKTFSNDTQCNPFLKNNIFNSTGVRSAGFSDMTASNISGYNITGFINIDKELEEVRNKSVCFWVNVLVLLIDVFVILALSIYLSRSKEEYDSASIETGRGIGQQAEEGVGYSYMRYHLILFVGSLYVMMTLSSWSWMFVNPSYDIMLLKANKASVWVKITLSWLCVIVHVYCICVVHERP